MNQAEVLAMLHNIIANNQHYTTWTVSTPHLVELVNQAVEAEREACAQIAEYKLDDKGLTAPDSPKHWWNYACKNIRDAIRARGQA